MLFRPKPFVVEDRAADVCQDYCADDPYVPDDFVPSVLHAHSMEKEEAKCLSEKTREVFFASRTVA